jgi:hypothetical protein
MSEHLHPSEPESSADSKHYFGNIEDLSFDEIENVMAIALRDRDAKELDSLSRQLHAIAQRYEDLSHRSLVMYDQVSKV